MHGPWGGSRQELGVESVQMEQGMQVWALLVETMQVETRQLKIGGAD